MLLLSLAKTKGQNGSLTSVSLPQSNCGNSVAYNHLCVNVCVNGRVIDCSVKHLGIL